MAGGVATLRVKYSFSLPPWEKMKGRRSPTAVLIGEPRFVGADQGASTLSRVETQMSLVVEQRGSLGVEQNVLSVEPSRLE